jgi:hypothetical protein
MKLGATPETPPLPGFPSDLRDPRRADGHGSHLTRMSEFGGGVPADLRRKLPRTHELPPVARCVHSFALVLLFVFAAALLGGCPPPPLELDEPDAASNLPPSITSVRKDDATEFQIGAVNQIVRTLSTMSVTVVESDLEDTLYVRGFFEYSEMEGLQDSARTVCNAGPSEPRSLERTISCNLGALCRLGESDPEYTFDVVVSDREPDDAGLMSPRRYLDVPPPGRQARATYKISCVEPPPT